MRNFLIIVYVLVYFAGCNHFGNNVSDACTHGNCKSGWYSKYNKSEKAVATLWMFGYPVALFFVHLIFFAETVPSKKSDRFNTVLNPKNTEKTYSSSTSSNQKNNSSPSKTLTSCPYCGGQMKMRLAKKGKFAGNKFMGCINYPRCKGIINLNGKSSLD